MTLRQHIVLAAPTCTLWICSDLWEGWVFRLWPAWRISREEYENNPHL